MADTVRLDDQLCFALYAASNAIVRSYRPLLHEIGLTYPQYLALMALWEADGVAIAQVADRLHLPGNALTPVLARLERLGYVRRTRDQGDGRVVRVSLTSRGAELESRAASAQCEVVRRTGLGPVSLASLRTRLHDLTNALSALAARDDRHQGEPS